MGRKKEGVEAVPSPAVSAQTQLTPTGTTTTAAPARAEQPLADAVAAKKPIVASPTKKKKKKKVGYKSMMAGMMEGSGQRDASKEKESIQKVTGGGSFAKVDKI